MHKQICVKVNAWVDREIAPIIEALSLIDGLVSFESCEDWFPNLGFGHIYFQYGYNNDMLKDWRVLGLVCEKLAEVFRKHNIRYIYVGLRWWGDNDHPFGFIIIKPDEVNQTVKAIEELASSERFSEFMAGKA